MKNLKEINIKLEKSFSDIASWIENQEDEKFIFAPKGKWQTCEHLDHLTQSAQKVKYGISLPKLFLRYKFGKPNRPCRTENQIIDRYREKLANLAPGTLAPMQLTKSPVSKKQECIQEYLAAGKALSKSLSKWNDKKIEKYLIPHPLLGRMHVKEMLIWVSYHNYHHLNTLKEKYS